MRNGRAAVVGLPRPSPAEQIEPVTIATRIDRAARALASHRICDGRRPQLVLPPLKGLERRALTPTAHTKERGGRLRYHEARLTEQA